MYEISAVGVPSALVPQRAQARGILEAMRVAVVVFALAACGRVDFDPLANQQNTGSGSLSITSVAPTWLMADDGGAITVALAGDIDGATVAIDGMPCTPTASVTTCTAPPHAPANVAVTATNAAGDSATWAGTLAYITPGMYQVGSTANDNTSGVAVDADGNIYVTGGTQGSLDGTNQGDWDAVLVKYDVTGQVAWIRQLGTPLYDYSRDVAVDPQGNATIVGYTAGNLIGTNAGMDDVFIARYAPDGTLLWVTQTGSPGEDQGWDVAVDNAGNTVVAVQTTGQLTATANAGGTDYAILHYDPTGTLDWGYQGGTAAEDFGHSVTITPDGTSYLVGYTTGALAGTNAGGNDLFVAQFDATGAQKWLRQRGGTGDDLAQDVMFDPAGGVWVVGSSTAAIDGQNFGGGTDVFVSRFAADGTWQYTHEYGGTGNENSWGVSVATDGTVYIQCVTTAGFDGQAYAGGAEDGCMIALDKTGAHLWTREVGGAGNDQASSCFVDNGRTGFAYMSMITDMSLDGMANRGGNDFVLAKLDATGKLR
jgi:hypothetical protein